MPPQLMPDRLRELGMRILRSAQRWTEDLDLALLTDRRGTAVIEVRSPTGPPSVLKIAHSASPIYDPSALVEREGRVLEVLAGRAAPTLLDRGSIDGSHWLLASRISGEPLGVALRAPDPSRLRRAVLPVLQAFRALHRASFLHGDPQPGHVLLSQQHGAPPRAILLDFAMSSGPGLPFCYRGANIRYAAPEVAGAMRERGAEIEYGIAQEIYAIAASCFHSYTSRILAPIEDRTLSFVDKLQIITDGERRAWAVRSLPRDRALEEALEMGLAQEPSQRGCSLDAIIAHLQAASEAPDLGTR